MPNYEGNERQNSMVLVYLADELIPGTIEHPIDWIIDHEADTSRFDATRCTRMLRRGALPTIRKRC